jgi:hypothetical protein
MPIRFGLRSLMIAVTLLCIGVVVGQRAYIYWADRVYRRLDPVVTEEIKSAAADPVAIWAVFDLAMLEKNIQRVPALRETRRQELLDRIHYALVLAERRRTRWEASRSLYSCQQPISALPSEDNVASDGD